MSEKNISSIPQEKWSTFYDLDIDDTSSLDYMNMALLHMRVYSLVIFNFIGVPKAFSLDSGFCI